MGVLLHRCSVCCFQSHLFLCVCARVSLGCPFFVSCLERCPNRLLTCEERRRKLPTERKAKWAASLYTFKKGCQPQRPEPERSLERWLARGSNGKRLYLGHKKKKATPMFSAFLGKAFLVGIPMAEDSALLQDGVGAHSAPPSLHLQKGRQRSVQVPLSVGQEPPSRALGGPKRKWGGGGVDRR